MKGKRIPSKVTYFVTGNPETTINICRSLQNEVTEHHSALSTYDRQNKREVQLLILECKTQAVAEQIYSRYHKESSPIRVWRRQYSDARILEVEMGKGQPTEKEEGKDPSKIPGIVKGSQIQQPAEKDPPPF